jgi:hypothetical protein
MGGIERTEKLTCILSRIFKGGTTQKIEPIFIGGDEQRFMKTSPKISEIF